jgi:hypothetical protein
MEATLRTKRAVLATAITLALGASGAFAASDNVTPANSTAPAAQSTAGPASNTTGSTTPPATSSTTTSSTTTAQPTGKEKATAIGAGTGAVAGAVVGGPVGALVGAGVGAYVGHEGTDSHGRPTDPNARVTSRNDGTVRKAQAALNDQGFDAGAVDGRYGPATQTAVRRFQSSKGLTETGTLDNSTLNALGVQ